MALAKKIVMIIFNRIHSDESYTNIYRGGERVPRCRRGRGAARRGGEARAMSGARAPRPARHAAPAHHLQAIPDAYASRHEIAEQPRSAQAG